MNHKKRTPKPYNSRKQNQRAKRTYNKRVLIVCEGEKTEPQYFLELVKDLQLQAIDVQIVSDCGSAPISVVNAALSKLKKDPDYDALFCVFDRDTHLTYEAACAKILAHRNKLPYKKFDHFLAVTSEPCFELWFMLHYKICGKPYGGPTPAKKLIADLKQIEDLKDYSKNNNKIYSLISSKTKQAIDNAIKTNKNSLASHTTNPHTFVHTLVQYLFDQQK